MDSNLLFMVVMLMLFMGVSVVGAMYFIRSKKLNPAQANKILWDCVETMAINLIEVVISQTAHNAKPETIARKLSDKTYDELSKPDNPKLVIMAINMITKEQFHDTFKDVFMKAVNEYKERTKKVK